MTGNQSTTQQELINKCFTYWNSLKRHRALCEIKRNEGKRDEANYHQLKMFQMGDALELAMRALQRGQREIDESTGEESE